MEYNFKISKGEKHKLFKYLVMLVLGFLLYSSIREIWLDDIMAKFSPEQVLAFSLVSIILMYLILDMDK